MEAREKEQIIQGLRYISKGKKMIEKIAHRDERINVAVTQPYTRESARKSGSSGTVD